jgi:hypothetical protein
MAMKVIFLDIDGVLNSGKYIKALDGAFDDPKNQMDPEAIKLINRLTDSTGAKLVVSSTWRLAFIKSADPVGQLAICMRSYGLTGEVIDMTNQCAGSSRGVEIQGWLDNKYTQLGIDKFVIIDDDSDIDHLRKYLVKTKFEFGLQEEHINQAIDMLK